MVVILLVASAISGLPNQALDTAINIAVMLLSVGGASFKVPAPKMRPITDEFF